MTCTSNCRSDQWCSLPNGRMAKTVKHTTKAKKGQEYILTKPSTTFMTWQSNDNQREQWELSFLLQPERSHTSPHIQKPITQDSPFGMQVGRHGRSLSHSAAYPLPRSSLSLRTYPHKASQECLSGLCEDFYIGAGEPPSACQSQGAY